MAAAQPHLSYWERNPPYAAVAIALYAKLPLEHPADPKGTKATPPTLKFPSGCAGNPWKHLTLLFQHIQLQ